jgi:hypothetical protein
MLLRLIKPNLFLFFNVILFIDAKILKFRRQNILSSMYLLYWEVKPKMKMKDWRGNEYIEEELGKPCEVCKNPAVRNCCTREGDKGRTHWHGMVHCKDGYLKALCRACAKKEE